MPVRGDLRSRGLPGFFSASYAAPGVRRLPFRRQPSRPMPFRHDRSDSRSDDRFEEQDGRELPDRSDARRDRESEAQGSVRRSRGLSGCVPWLMAGLAVLGGGFYWGYNFRAAQKLSADELRERERQELRTMGWQTSADGVLTRWCTDDCNPPKLFGGGMARIFEVYCKDRPCGNIRATFRVLDRDGREIGTTTASKDGLQGERLRLVVVSPEAQAERFELKEFTAQAMVY